MNRQRWSLIRLFLSLFLLMASTIANGQTDPLPGSILHPLSPEKTVLRYPIDAIDPSPQSNLKGAKSPGFRGAQQLVLYTPAFGRATQTDGSGAEAVVVDGKVAKINSSNTAIPAKGFVISGQGQSGQWLKRVIKPGAAVELDSRNRQIAVTTTLDVYRIAVRQAIETVEKRAPLTQDVRYHEYLSQAKDCSRSIETMGSNEVTPELIELSAACIGFSNRAFYRSISPAPNEFRGIWVRPTEKNPTEVKEAVASLKAVNIQHIFLETYYEGKTIYPSAVMAEYGLPVQYHQFDGWDPLKAWIEAASEQNMKVHAWVQTFYAGNQNSSLETYGPILQKYPQWSNVPYNALDPAKPKPSPSRIEAGYYFLDPANVEVRAFLEKLFLEIATLYPIHGINLDYIRYPESRLPTHSGYLASTWGYTTIARKAFQEQIALENKEAEAKKREEAKKSVKPLPKPIAGSKRASEEKHDPKDLTPASPLWPNWVEWRKDQVSGFVKNISQKVHALRPDILVSAVVFPSSDPLGQTKLQDWPLWADQGWIQALTPIGLGSSMEEIYTNSLMFKRFTQGKVPVYVGLFGMYNRQPPMEFLSQIEAVHRAGLPGIVLFERSRLTPDYKEALLEGAFRE